MYSTKLLSSDPKIHFLMFEGCMFEGNKALSGSAVDIDICVYPVPQFIINSSFESNSIVGRRHCMFHQSRP